MSSDPSSTSHTPTSTTETTLRVSISFLVFLLNNQNKVINDIANGTHPLCEELAECERPMVILGSSVFERADGSAIHQSVKKMCESLNTPEGWNPFNIMHKSASTVGALDLGYKTGVEHIKGRKPDVIINLGADEGLITRDDVMLSKNISFKIFRRSLLPARSSTSDTMAMQVPPTPTLSFQRLHTLKKMAHL